MSDFWSHILSGAIGGVIGAAITPPIRHWWDDNHRRRDAARFFLRHVEPIRTALDGLWRTMETEHFKGQYGGPRGLRPGLESLQKAASHFGTASDRVFDLRNEDLEKRVVATFTAAQGLHDQVYKESFYFFPETFRDDLVWDEGRARLFVPFVETIKTHLLPATDQLIADLREHTDFLPGKGLDYFRGREGAS